MQTRSSAATDLVDPATHRDAVVGLVDKYERMRALRGELGRGQPSMAARETLRELSRAFPGALRELELLPTTEIDARLAAARAAQVGLVPAWLVWTARYHALMKAALERKRSGTHDAAPHGRLNVVVFHALGTELGVAVDIVWEQLFPTTHVSVPRHRR